MNNSILCGKGGKWAISAAGEGRISHQTEIAFPHEPHTLFFVTTPIFTNAAEVISNTIVMPLQSICFDYVHANALTLKIKKRIDVCVVQRDCLRGGAESSLHQVQVCLSSLDTYLSWQALRVEKQSFPSGQKRVAFRRIQKHQKLNFRYLHAYANRYFDA